MRMSSIRYAITRWPASIVGCWLRNELWDVFNRQIEESEALHSFVSKTDVFRDVYKSKRHVAISTQRLSACFTVSQTFYCLYDHGMQKAGVRRHRPDALPRDGNETTPPILAMFAVPRSVLPY